VNTNYDGSSLFINYVLENSAHNLTTLSEILGIPKKRLEAMESLTKYDHIKIENLKNMVFSNRSLSSF